MLLEKYKALSALLSKKHIDWETVESVVKSLGEQINQNCIEDSYDEHDTVLSKLYFERGFLGRGDVLLKLTTLFLQYGYDVHANNDYNGAVCLYNLCWSSYDKYVLPMAELLLNNGANTHIKMEDDDEDGILNSISWKLGYWHTGEFEAANMFEAYYQMIQAEQAGKDYRGIRDVSDCLDMTVTKVECIGAPDSSDNRISFQDAIIIWFDTIPLIVDKRIELVINPNRANQANQRGDVSAEFSKIIGQKFTKYRFYDDGYAALFFENDIKLLLSNNWTHGAKDVIGCLEIKSKFAPNHIKMKR